MAESTKSVALIDYGAGNIRNVEKAFEAVGVATSRTSDPARVAAADVIVMPGVGAFGEMMGALRERGLVEPLREAARAGKPLLGICVGLQVLFEVGEEMGEHEGLGLFPGRVRRFQVEPLKVPHVGWNQIYPTTDHALFDGISSGDYVYFVHSYHVAPTDPSLVLATTEYGIDFPAICGCENILGIQFHPEKSQQSGLRMLANFARWAGVV
ncbi:MAG: imidazole glycerol phosphate synthase subunit HisH [Ardenticatenales bacterium]|nr:imidazole glycerol phosphate synthase subunit HisH [Ardenticatenales bacterium]